MIINTSEFFKSEGLNDFSWGSGNSHKEMKYSISTQTLYFIKASSEKKMRGFCF